MDHRSSEEVQAATSVAAKLYTRILGFVPHPRGRSRDICAVATLKLKCGGGDVGRVIEPRSGERPLRSEPAGETGQ